MRCFPANGKQRPSQKTKAVQMFKQIIKKKKEKGKNCLSFWDIAKLAHLAS